MSTLLILWCINIFPLLSWDGLTTGLRKTLDLSLYLKIALSPKKMSLGRKEKVKFWFIFYFLVISFTKNDLEISNRFDIFIPIKNCFRSICDDVGVRFGEASFGIWTPWTNAGMSWCCSSSRSSTRTVWPSNWWISIYTGSAIVIFYKHYYLSCTHTHIYLHTSPDSMLMFLALQKYRGRWLTCTQHYNRQGKIFCSVTSYYLYFCYCSNWLHLFCG